MCLGQQGGEQAHVVFAHTAHDVAGGDLARVLQARHLHQLLQRVQGLLVEVEDACGLVGHHQRLLPDRVLRGDAGRAMTDGYG
jgi:hypothetical protein